ncbi:MAG: hypothetical protein A3F92_16770 [Candidatus Rokubacteria bacterium RIFCSPLOWO2_12_FULL_71_22]|nr:MAG: hypothetical protein A3F92_16770 [Candidatus Rokubacteria bacterium RIFCSPLOWO2_12_FULL_71_22]
MKPRAPERPRGRARWTAASLVGLACVLAAVVAVAAEPKAAASAAGAAAEYRSFYGGSARLVIWIVAQVHLMFGAFVLGVPIFASIVEVIGWRGGDERYDRLAHEFTGLLSAAFSTTAAFGGLLVFALIGLYPRFMTFLTSVFHETYYVYALLFFAEGFTLYLYYYGWDRMRGRWKGLHVVLGILLNVWGTALMLIANAWVAYMMAPTGIDKKTLEFVGTTWQAVANPLWIPLGIHRVIGNAAFGGLLVFALIGLYPRFMTFLTSVFHETYYVYALLFFAEGFTLYLYYYGWDRMRGRWKGLHVVLGILLNVWGTALMLIANAWVAYMMAPTGIDKKTLEFVGTTWQAVANPLWIPLGIHRVIGNVAFGGFIVGAYAAVKFLGAADDRERAHYDWMGYVGNFVGLAALIPLPFAGYYLGREVYSTSAVMGNNMMGGAFSWTFILQAVLIGILFIGGNYYLWIGMGRIEGAERYRPYIKYINLVLLLSFAVWLTPRNIPLTGEEQTALGGQFHPLLKYLGLMSAKNAAVNFIILSTFFSFLLYRRGNKGRTRPFAAHGRAGRVALGAGALVSIAILLWYAEGLLTLDPRTLDLTAAQAGYFRPPVYLLLGQAAMVLVTAFLTLRDRGTLAQALFFASTTLASVFVLGVYGFVVMEKANPFLRNVAVAQWLMVMVCLFWNTVLDVLVFRGAEAAGGIRWGRMPARSQYTLILLCVTIVMLMGLMGFIRSGLREDWHVYGVLQDTSPWAWTPTTAYMTRVVGGIVLAFLGLVAFVFWLAGLGQKKDQGGAPA